MENKLLYRVVFSECSDHVTALIHIITPACHSSGRDDALHISAN